MSNWVRYVNCARNYIERNLIAMQIQNEIFYVTNTDIEKFVLFLSLIIIIVIYDVWLLIVLIFSG